MSEVRTAKGHCCDRIFFHLPCEHPIRPAGQNSWILYEKLGFLHLSRTQWHTSHLNQIE